ACPKHPRTGYFVTRRLFDRLDGFADLEARIAALPVGDRGDAFEVFAEAYQPTQKLVNAKEVWPADQVPVAVLQTCRLPIQDMGADGVYKYERLTKEDLEAIADWLRGAVFTPKRKPPKPHQSEALEAILAGLDKHDRVTAVMACATGKTLVALWLAERMMPSAFWFSFHH